MKPNKRMHLSGNSCAIFAVGSKRSTAIIIRLDELQKFFVNVSGVLSAYSL